MIAVRRGGDPAAEAGVAVEYGLLENLGVGAGWTYVDGDFTQQHWLEAYARGYLFGTPLDAFAAAAVQVAAWPGFDFIATLRAVGRLAAALFQFPGVGWLGGVYVGVRL